MLQDTIFQIRDVLKQLGYPRDPSQDIEGVQADLNNYLTRKVVLLLFDNVNSRNQADLLLRCCEGRSPDSLILFTSRAIGNLRSLPQESQQQVKLMGDRAAFSLVCEMAELGVVDQGSDLEKAVYEAVKACGGLPLALKILGRHLSGDFERNWKVWWKWKRKWKVLFLCCVMLFVDICFSTILVLPLAGDEECYLNCWQCSDLCLGFVFPTTG